MNIDVDKLYRVLKELNNDIVIKVYTQAGIFTGETEDGNPVHLSIMTTRFAEKEYQYEDCIHEDYLIIDESD